MNLAKRLNQVIEQKGISNYKIAKQLKISPSTVANYRDGTTVPSLDKLEAISNLLDVSMENLMGNTTEPQMEHTMKYKAVPANPIDPDAIPLLDTTIEAGVIRGFSESQLKAHLPHYNVPGFKGADFLATVSGESMIDRYWPGDVVGCKIVTGSSFIQWGKVHVLDTSQGGLLKKVMPSETPDAIKAVSFNEINYPAFEVPKNEVNGMAIVLGIVRLI